MLDSRPKDNGDVRRVGSIKRKKARRPSLVVPVALRRCYLCRKPSPRACAADDEGRQQPGGRVPLHRRADARAVAGLRLGLRPLRARHVRVRHPRAGGGCRGRPRLRLCQIDLALDVRDEAAPHGLLPVEHLDGHALPGLQVARVVHLGEGAFAQDAAQLVPPHEQPAGAGAASLGRRRGGGGRRGRQPRGLRRRVRRRRLDGRHRRVVEVGGEARRRGLGGGGAAGLEGGELNGSAKTISRLASLVSFALRLLLWSVEHGLVGLGLLAWEGRYFSPSPRIFVFLLWVCFTQLLESLRAQLLCPISRIFFCVKLWLLPSRANGGLGGGIPAVNKFATQKRKKALSSALCYFLRESAL